MCSRRIQGRVFSFFRTAAREKGLNIQMYGHVFSTCASSSIFCVCQTPVSNIHVDIPNDRCSTRFLRAIICKGGNTFKSINECPRAHFFYYCNLAATLVCKTCMLIQPQELHQDMQIARNYHVPTVELSKTPFFHFDHGEN